MKYRKVKDYYPQFTVKRFNLLFHIIFLVLKLFNRIYMREIKMLMGAKIRSTVLNVTQWHPFVAKVTHSL